MIELVAVASIVGATAICLLGWRMEVWLERIARTVGWTDLPQEQPPVGLMDGLTDAERKRGRGTGWRPGGPNGGVDR